MRICGKTLSHAYYLDKQLQSINSYTTGNTSDLITKTTFENSYSVTHTNAEECIKKIDDINPQDITIYTDGSLIKGKTNNTSGAGFTVVQNNNIRFEQSMAALGSYSSINQCELYAINMAAKWIESSNITNTNIYIFTDSKSTLFKLEKGYTLSKLTLETVNLLNRVTNDNFIELLKVPAHIGIEGNERADKLAKEGSEALPIGPEPFTGFTIGNIMSDLHSKLKKAQREKIISHNIKPFSKTPVLNYLNNKGKNNSINSREHLTILTHLFSDQIHLAKNDSQRDSLIVPFCRHCPD